MRLPLARSRSRICCAKSVAACAGRAIPAASSARASRRLGVISGPASRDGGVADAQRVQRAAQDALGVEAGLGVHGLGLVLVLEDVRQGERADLQAAVEDA